MVWARRCLCAVRRCHLRTARRVVHAAGGSSLPLQRRCMAYVAPAPIVHGHMCCFLRVPWKCNGCSCSPRVWGWVGLGLLCLIDVCVCIRHRVSVVLRESMDTVGFLGEEVSVKAGFARNYLIPQQKAVYATPENRQEFKIEYEVRRQTWQTSMYALFS